MNLEHWLGKDGDAVWAEYLTEQKRLAEERARADAAMIVLDSTGEE